MLNLQYDRDGGCPNQHFSGERSACALLENVNFIPLVLDVNQLSCMLQESLGISITALGE